MQWVIKVTKLCNLRCNYCYEWDSLSDPSRMSKEVWKHSLTAILEYSKLAEKKLGIPIVSDIIWHGGEPLLLPVSYYEMVLNLQKDIFPSEWIIEGRIKNCIQTNLYSLSNDHLEVLRKHNFDIGVSFDFIHGVRVSTNGKETEKRVNNNLLRLNDSNVSFEIITVLANHTVSNYHQLFQELSDLNVPAKLLPLFGGPQSRNLQGVEVSRDEVLYTMIKLFELWLNNNLQPKIHPFDECLTTIIMKKLGLVRPLHDRSKLGSEVLVVDRDGSLSCAAHRSSYVIANVSDMRITEILSTSRYNHLEEDEHLLKKQVCENCVFYGHCDTSPIASNFDSYEYRDCVIEKSFYAMTEAYLDGINFFNSDFFKYSGTLISNYIKNEMASLPWEN